MKRSLTLFLLFIALTELLAESSPLKISRESRSDIKLMWETIPMSDPHQRASSRRATEAARRVFLTVPIVGLTLPEVIQLLGDPKTASRSVYNFPFYPIPKNSIAYRFDTGMGGWQFNLLHDRNGRVTKVIPQGIE